MSGGRTGVAPPLNFKRPDVNPGVEKRPGWLHFRDGRSGLKNLFLPPCTIVAALRWLSMG